MTPGGLVSLTVGLTCGAFAAQRIIDLRRRRVLRELASEWGMNFNPGDQLRLAARVAQYLPVTGAANVTVGDIIYGIDGDFYRYVFTAEYTLGILRTKHRHVRVASFAEPRDRTRTEPPELVRLASAELPLLEQYRTFSRRREEISPTAD